MPYGGKDGKELPENVKKLSPKKQRQWMHVWNSAFAKHGDESKAFAMANGVVGKEVVEKGYVESWQVRTISQEDAGYSPVGGSGEKMCASCNWFVPSADGCAIVSGDIVPTGLSDFWLEKQEYHMPPMPVVIVGEKDLDDEFPDEWEPFEEDDKELVEALASLPSEKAVWSGASKNDLPDSAFAYIEGGGKKDSDGKTTPRSLRHLPYKNADGKPDAAHVRNALARLNQTGIPASAKASAHRKLVAAAKELGIEVSKKSVSNVNVAGVDLVNGVANWVQRVMRRATPPPPSRAGESPLLFYKSADGSIRWFARYSNCYKDRDREFISAASHKEYVEWIHRTGVYPELWLWHTAGSRIGKADFVGFEDGLAIASGLIDEKSKAIAERLSDGVDNLGASHGFLPVVTIGNVVHKHWTFEITVLPKERASAYGTGYNFYKLVGEDSVKPEQREWFKSQGVPEDMIDAWASANEGMAKALRESGLEYKEVTDDGTNVIGLLVQQQAAVTKAISDLSTKVAELGKPIEAKVDSAVAAAITPAVTPTTAAHVPTQDPSNIVPATKEDKLVIDDETAKMMEMMFGVKVGA